MFATRLPGARGARLLRAARGRRLQSTQAGGSSPFAAGVAGGVAGAGLLYGIYLVTPAGRMARKINAAAREAEAKCQKAAAAIQAKTPTTDEAADGIRRFCYSYVAWVPGGRQYVDAAFDDVAALRASHGDEVDRMVAEAYRELQEVARAGLSAEAASRAYDAVAALAGKLASLGGRAADQILARHPQLDDAAGGPIRELKQMAAQYGPDARRLADETWKQVNDALAGGFSAEAADRVRRIVEERTQEMRRVADDFWRRGLEQARPYLDRNPRVRELVAGNADVLKQGNAAELFRQVKKLGEGGDAGQLEDYVRQAVERAREAGSQAAGGSGAFGALAQLLGPASGDAGRRLRDDVGVLSELATKHASEGKGLLEETRDDLQKLLGDKAKKAREIVGDK